MSQHKKEREAPVQEESFDEDDIAGCMSSDREDANHSPAGEDLMGGQQETPGDQAGAGNEDGAEEEEFEMLEMLCDAAEADDYKESKQKELKLMNQIMDERQRKRDAKA